MKLFYGHDDGLFVVRCDDEGWNDEDYFSNVYDYDSDSDIDCDRGGGSGVQQPGVSPGPHEHFSSAV